MNAPQDIKNALAAYCLRNDIKPEFTNPYQLLDGIDIELGNDTPISSFIGCSVYAPEFSLQGDGYVVQDVVENEYGVVVIVGNADGTQYALSTINFEDEYIDFQTYQRNQMEDLAEQFPEDLAEFAFSDDLEEIVCYDDSGELDYPEIGNI